MASRQHNHYLTTRTHAYWFYSRGSSISDKFIAPTQCKVLWDAVVSQHEIDINKQLRLMKEEMQGPHSL